MEFFKVLFIISILTLLVAGVEIDISNLDLSSDNIEKDDDVDINDILYQQKLGGENEGSDFVDMMANANEHNLAEGSLREIEEMMDIIDQHHYEDIPNRTEYTEADLQREIAGISGTMFTGEMERDSPGKSEEL